MIEVKEIMRNLIFLSFTSISINVYLSDCVISCGVFKRSFVVASQTMVSCGAFLVVFTQIVVPCGVLALLFSLRLWYLVVS